MGIGLTLTPRDRAFTLSYMYRRRGWRWRMRHTYNNLVERTTAVTMALRLFGTRDLLHDICGRCNLGWHGNSWRHTIGDRHASTGQETAGHTNADAAGMAAADPANSEAWTRNSDVFSGGASRSYTPYAQTRQFDTALEEQRSTLLRQPRSYPRDSLAQKGGALIGWLCGLAAPQTCGPGARG